MKRYELLDTIRGITIISMILFHACWDLWYFGLGIDTEFLYGTGAYIWQQSICWTFILLSGFCFSFGSHHVKRGLLELGGGILISVVTFFVVPDALDLFGVLWLLGSSTLILALFASGKKKISMRSAAAGFVFFLFLFFLTRNVNSGYLGFERFNLLKLPASLYSGYHMTYLGFPDPSFRSSDYFSLIPWIFLFTTGFFLHKIAFGTEKGEAFMSRFFSKGIRPLSFLGRHSLLVYMLHQVLLYGVIYLIWLLMR